jgi:ankyrin repeat protein
LHDSHSRPIDDAFVDAVHHDPTLAALMLTRQRRLAHAGASWGETGLQAASHLGRRELIHRLLRAGATLDVYAACALGDWPAARSMLAGSAALGVHCLPLSHFAVMSGDPGVLQALVDDGVNLNPPGASLSPLHSAVAIGSIPMIRALIAAGVDRDVTDAFGATALDWAYEVEDRGSVLALLLAAGLRPAAALRTAG